MTLLSLKYGFCDKIRGTAYACGISIAENNNCDPIIDITPNLGDKAFNAAAMGNGLMLVHLSNSPAIAITQAGNGHLCMRGEPQVQQLLWQQLFGVESLIPQVEIFHGRIKTAGCIGNSHIDGFGLSPQTASSCVANCQAAIIMIVASILHLQRRKDMFL